MCDQAGGCQLQGVQMSHLNAEGGGVESVFKRGVPGGVVAEGAGFLRVSFFCSSLFGLTLTFPAAT